MLLQEKTAVNVGIDVSKDWLDMHMAPSGRRLRTAYTAQGLAEIVSAFDGVAVERVVNRGYGQARDACCGNAGRERAAGGDCKPQAGA